MSHYGSYQEMHSWYLTLPDPVMDRIHLAGFGDFMTVISNVQRSTYVFQAFTERWWATTNTFHLGFGKMTITSLDFSMLTGLRCGGPAIPLYGNIHQRPAAIARCLGDRFAASAILSERVFCLALREFFHGYVCETIEDIDILAQAFILHLLGSCLLSNVDNTVHLGFLRALEDLNQITRYDWEALP